MSNRTAEATKAVRKAWGNERELVKEGKGTRIWTPEQQQSILDKGIAYDEDGRAFEGHHMMSVESHPEYQGHSENIEFLTRKEHLDAHAGSFQNPTNGYYDPYTKQTREFTNDIYQPCKIIEQDCSLKRNIERQDINNDFDSQVITEELNQKANVSKKTNTTNKIVGKKQVQNNIGEKIINSVGCGFSKLKNFVFKHPGEFIEISGAVIGSAIKYAVTKNNNNESYNNNTYIEINDNVSIKHDYPVKRSSPIEHSVSGYNRHQNGKTVHVNGYKRGVESSDD